MESTLLVGIVIVLLYLWSTINILKEYERGVVFRLGRLVPKAMGPGLIFVFWPIYKMVRVSLRTITARSPAPGHHYARQRFGEGQCDRLFPRDERAAGDCRG